MPRNTPQGIVAPLVHGFRRTATGLLVPFLDREKLKEDLLLQAGGSYRSLRKMGFHSMWNAWGTGPDGRLLWADMGLHNLVPDEGEQWLLEVAFSEQQTVPVSFGIGLTTEVATNIDEETTEVTINDGTDGDEPSGFGYARQLVTSDDTDFPVVLDATDWQAESKTVTFTASGGAIPAAGIVDWMFLATGAAGKLVAAVALSTDRTILDGDSLNTDIAIKASE